MLSDTSGTTPEGGNILSDASGTATESEKAPSDKSETRSEGKKVLSDKSETVPEHIDRILKVNSAYPQLYIDPHGGTFTVNTPPAFRSTATLYTNPYHKRSYTSPNIGIDSDTLVEETTEYFRNYNLNGIEGGVTLFGDLALPPAVQVELVDHRNPSKNGVYLVEEVVTTFGVGGYRQRLSLPYRVSSGETYGSG